MEKMTFNGSNLDEIKEFAGDACEIITVYDKHGIAWGKCPYIKTTNGLGICLMRGDVVIKDDKGIHVCR